MKKRILSLLVCISVVAALFVDFVIPQHDHEYLDIYASAAEGDAVVEDGGNTDDVVTIVGCTCGYVNDVHEEGCPRYGCTCEDSDFVDGGEGADIHNNHECQFHHCDADCDLFKCAVCGAEGDHYTTCSTLCLDVDCSDGAHATDCPLYNVVCEEGTCLVKGGHTYLCNASCDCGSTDDTHTEECMLTVNAACDYKCLISEGHFFKCAVNCDKDCDVATHGKHKYNCITQCICPTEQKPSTHILACQLRACTAGCEEPDDPYSYKTHNIGCFKYLSDCVLNENDGYDCKISTIDLDDDYNWDIAHADNCPNNFKGFCSGCTMMGTMHAPGCSKDNDKTENITTVLNTDGVTATTADGITTYTLTKDITLNSTIIIGTTGKYVINLNGHMLRHTGVGSVIKNYGQLTVEDGNPTAVHYGKLVDRGYYYFWTTTDHFKNVRVIEDAVWVPITDAEKETLDADEIVAIYGGVITGGKISLSGDTDMTIPLGVDNGTPQDIVTLLSDPEKSDYFRKVILQNRYVQQLGLGGAGIANVGKSANLTMNSGTIAGCETVGAYSGSAVLVRDGASFTMNGGSIKYNFAYAGGAVMANLEGSTFTMRDGLIFKNPCVAYGAITARNSATVEIGDLTDKNDGNLGEANGTPDWDEDGFYEAIERATNWETPIIYGNRAMSVTDHEGNGGGIYADTKVQLLFHAGLFMKNWSHYRGGGIDLYQYGKLVIDGDLDVIANYCEAKGGGISVHYANDFTTTDGVSSLAFDLTSNEVNIELNKAAYGGGLYLSHLDFNMTGGTVKNNDSVGFYIPQAYAADAGNPLLDTVIDYDGNVADVYDTGDYSNQIVVEDENGDITIGGKKYSKIDVTGSEVNGGGAFRFEGDVEVDISGGEISGNRARTTGGAIFSNGGIINISGDTVVENNRTFFATANNVARVPINEQEDADDKVLTEATGNGGAIYLSSGTINISGGRFEDNETKTNNGDGGLLYITEGTLNITGGTFTNNYSRNDQGGAIYLASGTVNVSNDDGDDSTRTIFTGGRAQNGGAIYVYKGTLTVSNQTTFTKNYVCDSGGAIYIDYGEVKLMDDTILIDDNSTSTTQYFSGGLYIGHGVCNMYGGTISNNKSSNSGGGAAVYDGAFNMYGGTISGNSSTKYGGGVHMVDNCTFNMYGGIITGNRSSAGGGVFVNKGTVNMTGGEISLNSTDTYNGGGVFCYGTFNMSGTYDEVNEVWSTTIHDNSSGLRSGGGVFVRGGSFVMDGGALYNNHADSDKTKPYNSNDNSLTDSQHLYGGGGAVAVDGGDVNIKKGDIYGNTSAYRGAGIVTYKTAGKKQSAVIIGTENADYTDVKIYDNHLTESSITGFDGHTHANMMYGGAAIYSYDANVTVNAADIYNNSTRKANKGNCEETVGGAILVYKGDFTFNDGEIHGNKSHNHWAGGIYVNGGNMTVNGGKIYDNWATDNGGAGFVNSGNLYIYGGDIYKNWASSYCGGAFCVSAGNVYMYGGKVRENYVKSSQAASSSYEQGVGGGFALHSTSAVFKMYGGEITNNSAGQNNNGGGIGFTQAGKCYIYGGTISGNTAASGAGIFMRKGVLQIGKLNCVGESDDAHNTLSPTESVCGHPIITNNTATKNGGGLMVESGAVDIYCGSISGNTATTYGGGIYVGNTELSDSGYKVAATINIYNATVSGNTAKNDMSGNNLYMSKNDSDSTLKYTKDNTFGTDTNPGVIVISGKYTYVGSTETVSIYLADRTTGEKKYTTTLPLGAKINLPDANEMWPTYKTENSVVFLGWQHPYEGRYVEKPSDYIVMGSAITVTADNYDGAEENTMTLYAVWAPAENIITYYKSQAARNEDNTNGNTGGNGLEPNVTKSYQYGSPVNVLGPTSQAGYDFEGWTVFQNRNKDGNWNLPLTGQSKNPAAPSISDRYYKNPEKIQSVVDGIERFGELQFAANWSATITYQVIGTGTLNRTSEDITVEATTTEAVGSTPVENGEYIFIGWFTDAACTVPANAAWVDAADGTLVPEYNTATGFYDHLTYYAKYVPRYTDITVSASKSEQGQSFVFVVESDELTYADALYGQQNATFDKMEVVFDADVSGEGEVTIKHVPVGDYMVYEKNCGSADSAMRQNDTWTWRYEKTGVKPLEATQGGNNTVDFAYNTIQKITYWLNYYTKKIFGIEN